MKNTKVLNNIEHADLRIDTRKKMEYGDSVGGSIIFPSEVLAAQKEYPIFFQKSSETGEFQMIVLFGFKQDENLFLTESGWQAEFIPAVIERDPFLIGFQADSSTGEKRPVVHIDMDSPRITSEGKGVPVFLDNGGNSPYLDAVTKHLDIVNEGVGAAQKMFEVFTEYALIESIALDIEFNDGTGYNSNMYYTINQDRIYELHGDEVVKLHQGGYLQLAYLILASFGNLKRLVDRRNALG